jgi:hypothetical protein
VVKFNRTLRSLIAVLGIVVALFIVTVLTFPGRVSANRSSHVNFS